MQDRWARNANPDTAAPRQVALILGLAGLLALGAGALLALPGWRSRRWPPAPGRILTSGVAHRDVEWNGDRKRLYWPAVRYSFEAAGRTFTNDRIAAYSLDTMDEAQARCRADGYPAGRTVSAYHDPSDPAAAVLERGASLRSRAWITGGFLILAAAAGIALRSRRAGNPSRGDRP